MVLNEWMVVNNELAEWGMKCSWLILRSYPEGEGQRWTWDKAEVRTEQRPNASHSIDKIILQCQRQASGLRDLMDKTLSHCKLLTAVISIYLRGSTFTVRNVLLAKLTSTFILQEPGQLSQYRGQWDWTIRVRFPILQDYLLLHSIQTGYRGPTIVRSMKLPSHSHLVSR
jgi:hypothetical protein